MNNGFTVLLMIVGIAVSARAYAQDVAPLALKAQVFPEPLCESLPEVRAELKTWVAQVARNSPRFKSANCLSRRPSTCSVAQRWRAGGASTSSPTAYSGSRAHSISHERRFAPWTRPSCWTS